MILKDFKKDIIEKEFSQTKKVFAIQRHWRY